VGVSRFQSVSLLISKRRETEEESREKKEKSLKWDKRGVRGKQTTSRCNSSKQVNVVESEVNIALTLKSERLCVVSRHKSVEVYLSFGGSYRLLLQSRMKPDYS
jgi:hypothetical protein